MYKVCDLFKNYVDVLYKLKDKKIQGSKMILNMLWGVLCEKKKTKHYIDINVILLLSICLICNISLLSGIIKFSLISI